MDASKFKVGQVYFLFTYFDKDLHIPSIDTFVYLGKDIFTETKTSEGGEWCFQTAQSYVDDGPYDPKTKPPADGLLLAGSDTIDDFLALPELTEKLQSQN